MSTLSVHSDTEQIIGEKVDTQPTNIETNADECLTIDGEKVRKSGLNDSFNC